MHNRNLQQDNLQQDKTVSNFLFWLYMYFVVDFFLHFSARVPAYGVIRPTLLLVLVISLMLLSQKDRFAGVSDDPVFRTIKHLIIYIIVTLPLVTWPGSVLFNNLPAFVKAVVFFFFTALIVDTEKRLKIFIGVYVVCQTLRVLEPLFMNITSGYWGSATHLGYGEFAKRLSGAPSDVINPNGLGFVIATVAPYLYYLGWLGRSVLNKLLFLAVMPLLLYALVLTMSRGGFIALLVVAFMIFKDSSRKLLLLLVGVAVLVVGWSNLSDVHKDRYLSLVSSSSAQSASARGRFEGMLNELSVVVERPVIGHGLGTSREAKTHAGVGWLVSHNLYIEILIEIGLVGFFIFLRYFKSIYNKLRENLQRIESEDLDDNRLFAKNLNMAMKAVFWMYVVYSFNYFGLSAYYWYLFGGLTIAVSRVFFESRRPDEAVAR